jgi:malic enzyme
MVDEFMRAVFDRWPNTVVQFEDFESSKAMPILKKYREVYRCFNDDIQGTGCVTLAGVIAAARQADMKLTEMSFLCAGAGSAGLGVCAQIVDGMVEAGLSREEAMSRFVVCTSIGAIGAQDGKHGDPNAKRGLNEERAEWLNPAVSDGASMTEVVQQFKPTCLLGLAAQPAGLFTEEMVTAMTTYAPRPIVMPMSNPTAKAECTPAQAYEWTNGTAVVATGSPFDPYIMPDGRKLIPSQCNNMYVFPGIGLAASVAGVKEITDAMLYAASVACVDAMTEEEFAAGCTFPAIDRSACRGNQPAHSPAARFAGALLTLEDCSLSPSSVRVPQDPRCVAQRGMRSNSSRTRRRADHQNSEGRCCQARRSRESRSPEDVLALLFAPGRPLEVSAHPSLATTI